MKLGEREETPEILLARHSAPGAYILEGEELAHADDLSEEGEFPEYGWFIPVTGTTGKVFVECPQDLDSKLVALDVEPGDGFRIRSVKKVEGSWRYEVEELTTEEREELEDHQLSDE